VAFTPEERLDYQRTARGKLGNLLSNARYRARRDFMPFDVTHAYLLRLWDVQRGACAYCGQGLVTDSPKPSPASPSIDKIIPANGYTMGNVALSCHGCNSTKMDHSPETMRAKAARAQAKSERWLKLIDRVEKARVRAEREALRWKALEAIGGPAGE